MNPRMILNNLILEKLRGNPGIEYTQSTDKMTVTIGELSWTGHPSHSCLAAKDSAAAEALQDLENWNETEIRELCGLPPRIHIVEVDYIRDVLKTLKGRTNAAWIEEDARRLILQQIRNVYPSIDQLEKTMREYGVSEM